MNDSSKRIAAIIGIVHALVNLPSRLSAILLMILPPYSPFFLYLINLNHEVQSFVSLSYAYKCFVCIVISRRFRFHAKNIFRFLVDHKYENRFQNKKNNPLELTKTRRFYVKNIRLLNVSVS